MRYRNRHTRNAWTPAKPYDPVWVPVEMIQEKGATNWVYILNTYIPAPWQTLAVNHSADRQVRWFGDRLQLISTSEFWPTTDASFFRIQPGRRSNDPGTSMPSSRLARSVRAEAVILAPRCPRLARRIAPHCCVGRSL